MKLFMSAKIQRRLNIIHNENDVESFGISKSMRPPEVGGDVKLPHVQMLWERDGWENVWVGAEGSEENSTSNGDHDQLDENSEDIQEESLTL